MRQSSKQKKTYESLDKRFELMQRFIRIKRQYEPEITSDDARTKFIEMLKNGWHNRYPFEKEEELIVQLWGAAWEKVLKAPATN